MDDLTGIESAIKSMWREILGRTELTNSDNFFKLGGDTEAAQQLCDEIMRKLGCPISPEEFYEMPTIGALAVMVRSNSTGSVAESLFCMQKGQPDRRVLYCFPPIGGSPARFSGLFDYLAPEQPVYGIQAVGLLPGRQPDRTVTAMARRYAQDITNHGPSGEAIFLGYSFGGLLAVETLRQLMAAGGARPVLAIIDCPPTSSEKNEDARAFSYQGLVETILQLPINAKTYVSSLMMLPQIDALRNIRDFAVRTGTLPNAFDLGRLKRIAEVCETSLTAAEMYQPRWVGGHLTVFESTAGMAADVGGQWSPYFDHVDIRRLDGDHRSVLEGEDLAPMAAWLADQAVLVPDPHQDGLPGQREETGL